MKYKEFLKSKYKTDIQQGIQVGLCSILIELKKEYYNVMLKNLDDAVRSNNTIFDIAQ